MNRCQALFAGHCALLLGIVLTLAACNYNKVKTPGERGGVSREKMENPDFAVVMGAVIGPKCVSCHSTAGGNKGATNLETYAAVRQYVVRVGYRSLETRDMPPAAPLSEREMKLLDRWIQNGAPEKVVEIGSKPEDDIGRGPNNWAKIRDKIFAPKCTACHQAPNAEGGVELTDVKVVRTHILKILGSVIGNGNGGGANMPPAPIPVVTPAERDVMLKWFNLGMPE